MCRGIPLHFESDKKNDVTWHPRNCDVKTKHGHIFFYSTRIDAVLLWAGPFKAVVFNKEKDLSGNPYEW